MTAKSVLNLSVCIYILADSLPAITTGRSIWEISDNIR